MSTVVALEVSGLQNSSVLQPLRDPVLPLPVQGDRACFESGSSTWGFEEVLPHGSFCDECVSNKVSIFDPQLHRRFCRSCGVSEYVMDLGNGTRICSLADGKEGCRQPKILGEHWLTCHPCPVGHVSNSSGATSCQPCPAGSSSPGGTGCVACSPGTFAGGAGTSCTACPGGRAAPDAGMTGCQGCPEGHRSDGVNCQKCPEGTYQPNQNSSECLLAVEGADFDGQGLVTGINREGYWTRRMGTEVTWEPCVAPQQCLRNESCASGSAGVQCFSCLPRHVRGGSDGCDPCNSLEAALGLGTFIVLVVFFALTLAKLGLARRNRPKDLRVVYIKIFLLYLVVADALLETALQALRLRPSVAFLSRFVVSAVSPQLLRWARCAGDAAARALEAVGASHGMVQALWASEMSEALASWELGGLNAWPHGSWFSPEARSLVQKLAAYQGAVELLQLIFWFLLPWVLWIFLYLSALCFVRLRLCKDRSFLKSCLRFYEELVKDGTRETLACYDAEDWLSFCKAPGSGALSWFKVSLVAEPGRPGSVAGALAFVRGLAPSAATCGGQLRGALQLGPGPIFERFNLTFAAEGLRPLALVNFPYWLVLAELFVTCLHWRKR
ncbi:unnamed protein product [Cladocopium goreaui]|uniref:Dynein heavy chain 2, axonemal n=1 Tax=Cladocopium goreaui TaxID=2562237 RepID=A0A9P1CRI7_9DINO|nr:unnamed protein product [Cladocopium goreaui]